MPKLDKVNLAALAVGKLHGDGDGLGLRVKSADNRQWIYRFTSPVLKKQREFWLGQWPQISLDDARIARNDAYKLIRQGLDPIEEKRKAEASREAARGPTGPTFKEWVEKWIAAESPAWTDDRHEGQVRASLESHAFPKIGPVPMTGITRTMVIEVLQPIWHTIPETARRVRQRIESVFTHFLANHEKITMANPADRAMIKKALGKQTGKKGNHPSLPYDDMATFMVALRTRTSISAQCLEFTILTAVRTTEALDAQWSEFPDKETWKIWVIPGERMKNGLEHTVPLSARAVEILQKLYVERDVGTEYVFPGMRYDSPMSNMAMLKVIELMGYRGRVTTHGFRATFRTWASEQTDHAHEVKEKALAHTVGDETVRAYNRGALLDKRRILMDDWDAFCAPPPPAAAEGDNVVRLRA